MRPPARRVRASLPADRLRGVAQPAHAELEVLDGDTLVRRVDEASGGLRVHRTRREEAIRDRVEGLPQPMRVGEARDADGRRDRSGFLRLDERLHRVPERAADLRAGAALTLEVDELIVALAEVCPDR